MSGEGSWHRVASAAELGEGEALGVGVGEHEIALCRLGGAVYAFEDICPHAYAQLSQGFVEGEEIECPLHGARFEIATGRCLGPPADRDLQCYPVRVEGEDIYVQVED